MIEMERWRRRWGELDFRAESKEKKRKAVAT
jgi:hypothetical protein